MSPATLIILAPAVTVLLLFFVPAKRVWAIRWIAVAGAASTVFLAIYMMAGYDLDTAGWQYEDFAPWVEELGISWNVGVDGISLAMLLLTSLVILAGTLVSFRIEDRVKEFYILLLALVTGGTGGVGLATSLGLARRGA